MNPIQRGRLWMLGILVLAWLLGMFAFGILDAGWVRP